MEGYSTFRGKPSGTTVTAYDDSPPEPFESVTGILRNRVVKTSTDSLTKYYATKIDTNSMLDLASADLWQGDYKKAAIKLRHIELYLCEWGKRDFASAIYQDFGHACLFPLNTNSQGFFAVTGFKLSPEEWSRGVWYMFNFFKERKSQLQDLENNPVFSEFLKSPAEFDDSFGWFQEQKMRAKSKSTANIQKIAENSGLVIDYLWDNVFCIPNVFEDMLQSVRYGSRITCPFQRSRYYLHKIGEEKETALEGILDEELFDLYSSPAFKDNSLPNWWSHLCLPFEAEKLSQTNKRDYSAFEKSARNVPETFFTINDAFRKDYGRIRSMSDGEWNAYVQRALPLSR